MGSLRASNLGRSAGSDEDNQSRTFKKCTSGKNVLLVSSCQKTTIQSKQQCEMGCCFSSATTITGIHIHYGKLLCILLIGDSRSILWEIYRVLFPGGKKGTEEKDRRTGSNFPLTPWKAWGTRFVHIWNSETCWKQVIPFCSIADGAISQCASVPCCSWKVS